MWIGIYKLLKYIFLRILILDIVLVKADTGVAVVAIPTSIY